MAYPILAPSNTWFTPTNSSVTRSVITEIEIMDSYTPDSSVTVVDSWDASAEKDGSITCCVIGTKLIMAGNGSGKIAMNADSSYMFADPLFNDMFANVISISNIHLLSCDNVITLSRIFAFMSSLLSLDLSMWNTGRVTDIAGLVMGCGKLSSLNVENWVTTQMTHISVMFRLCQSLTNIIGFDKWEFPNLEDCWGCFDNTPFVSLDLTKWNVSKVMKFDYVVANMPNLTTIDISNWDISLGTESYGMFLNNPKLANFYASNLKLGKSVESMFSTCDNLTTLDTSTWDTSLVENMKGMFLSCYNLTNIDTSKWNMSSVKTTHSMFANCSKLANLDVTKWNLSSCTDMAFMFYSCSSLGEIDVSNWDVSKVTNFDHFAAHANLKRKGIENWKTTSATNMNALFHNCAEEELDLSGWDVSKVQFFCQMFENSPNLKRIKGLEKWNTSAGLGFDGMFERCYKLEEVDLSAFNTTKAKNGTTASENGHKTATLQNMFLSCNNLKKVTLGPNFAINGNGSNTSAANKLILPTPSTDYIEGADGNWYSIGGTSYTPSGIPDRTACVYFASRKLIEDLDVIIPNKVLLDIAAALREVSGSTNKYKPENFSEAILALKA